LTLLSVALVSTATSPIVSAGKVNRSGTAGVSWTLEARIFTLFGYKEYVKAAGYAWRGYNNLASNSIISVAANSFDKFTALGAFEIWVYDPAVTIRSIYNYNTSFVVKIERTSDCVKVIFFRIGAINMAGGRGPGVCFEQANPRPTRLRITVWMVDQINRSPALVRDYVDFTLGLIPPA